MADTVVDDLVPPKSPWVLMVEELIEDALPRVLDAYAGGESAVEIAGSAVVTLLEIGADSVRAVLDGQAVESVRVARDKAIGDLVEAAKFGPAVGQ
jgi:hypothetical protein